jgi:hypothetical protein
MVVLFLVELKYYSGIVCVIVAEFFIAAGAFKLRACLRFPTA